jgi:hypothetical protein
VRALLLNRFWVLERSVDIYGADFLVQRRLTERSALDRQHLGLVQVKYVQNGDTTIAIPASYFLDGTLPRQDFFLLVCTGEEDTDQMFLLGAEQIQQTLPAKNDVYTGKAKLVLEQDALRVLSKSLALTRIENALASVSLADSRRYLSQMGYIQPEPGHIDDDLMAPIENGYADIPQAFRALKATAREILLDLEYVADGLRHMVATTDPEEYARVYASTVREHVDGYGQLGFSARNLLDEDLSETVIRVRAYQARLDKAGWLSQFVALLAQLRAEVDQFLLHLGGRSIGDALHVVARYGAPSLASFRVAVTGEARPCVAPGGAGAIQVDDRHVTVLKADAGHLEFCFDLTNVHPSPELIHDTTTPTLQTLLHRQIFGDDQYL